MAGPGPGALAEYGMALARHGMWWHGIHGWACRSPIRPMAYEISLT